MEGHIGEFTSPKAHFMTPAKAKIAPQVRRLNFILADASYRELQDLASESHRSMTELVRYSLGLMRLLMDAQRNKHRLMVVDENGKAVKEIVMPI